MRRSVEQYSLWQILGIWALVGVPMALVAGAVATVIGARAMWLIGAAGILAGSLGLIFSPVRRLQVPPGEQTLDPG
jgi:hypothetical protein